MAELIDPGASTRPGFNRRVFVGIGAGAASIGGTIAAALAQADGFGKPHPPIVAENDPAITVEHPALDRPGGSIASYAAYPKNATASTPGLVVVQAVWGVDAQLRDVVRRFAKEGFVAIAPSLYDREHPPEGDTQADFAARRPLLAKITALPDQVDGDLQAGELWLRKRAGVAPDAKSPKIGVTGFCAGGGMTIRQAWKYPARYVAIAPFYGPVRQSGPPAGEPLTDTQLAYVDAITVPVNGSYGGRDTGILSGDVQMFAARLKPAHDVKIYPEAGHGFFDDTRDSYVASAAADAWTRTLAFLRKYLSA